MPKKINSITIIATLESIEKINLKLKKMTTKSADRMAADGGWRMADDKMRMIK